MNQTVTNIINDPTRLLAVARTHLLDRPTDPTLDSLAEAAAQALTVPICALCLVDAHRIAFAAGYHLPEPWRTLREAPLSRSFAQRVIATGAPVQIADVQHQTVPVGRPAIADMGIVAYLGVPLVTAEGHVIGVLAAMDTSPHEWSGRDLQTLARHAEVLLAEIDRRQTRSMERQQRLAAEVVPPAAAG
jgi:GAF domain-containing protein